MIGYALLLLTIANGMITDTNQGGLPALASVQMTIKWASVPSQKQLREVVPDSILQRTDITVSCAVNSEGGLYECKSVEGAISSDMEVAAMALTRFYKIPAIIAQASILPAHVTFVIRFSEDAQGNSLPNGPCVAPGCVTEYLSNHKN